MLDWLGHIKNGYEFIDTLGLGGNGVVYRARTEASDVVVAIKVMALNTLDAMRQFETEIALVRQLHSPYILPILDHWHDTTHGYLVMPFMPQGSLHGLCLRKGTLSLPETLHYLHDIVEGLTLAHDQHIVHADLKPTNVLIGQDNRAVLADFGSATLTNTPRIGTYAYLSPEQIQHHAITPQTDIYALGILLYELLTGQRPFSTQNLKLLLISTLHESAPNLLLLRPDLPPLVNQVFQQATAKKPTARYAHVKDLWADLQTGFSG